MTSNKVFSWLACAVICSLLLTAGCMQPAEKAAKPEVELEKVEAEAKAEPKVEAKAKPEKQAPKAEEPEAITLALKFTPQDVTTYKVITQKGKSVKFESESGALSDDSTFKGGHNDSRVEMIFTQQIQSIDDKGNAAAKITIKELKCSAKVRDKPILDFDSSRIKNQNNPLAKLIGQSYTIKISPTGQVIDVNDASQAQAVVKGSTSVHKRALLLLNSTIIRERHGTMLLPFTAKNRLQTGDKWSRTKIFAFGLMGTKTYERIYTLKEIKDQDGQHIAVADMNTIPSSEMAEELHKEQESGDLPKMFNFDSTVTYAGQLDLDLTAGKIKKYSEELQSEWVMVDPAAKLQEDKAPDTVRMTATRFYSIEKIN